MKVLYQPGFVEWPDDGCPKIIQEEEEVFLSKNCTIGGSASSSIDENNKENNDKGQLEKCPGFSINGFAPSYCYKMVADLHMVHKYRSCKKNLLSFFRAVNESNFKALNRVHEKIVVRKSKKIPAYVPDSDPDTDDEAITKLANMQFMYHKRLTCNV